jgi:hypothetical protein
MNNNQTLMFCYPVNKNNIEGFESSTTLPTTLSGFTLLNPDSPLAVNQSESSIWQNPYVGPGFSYSNAAPGPQGEGNQVFFTPQRDLISKLPSIPPASGKTNPQSRYYLIEVDEKKNILGSMSISNLNTNARSPYRNTTTFSITGNPELIPGSTTRYKRLFSSQGANYYVGFISPTPATAVSLRIVTAPEVSYDNYNKNIWLQNPNKLSSSDISSWFGKKVTGGGISNNTTVGGVLIQDSMNNRSFHNAIRITLSNAIDTTKADGVIVIGP